MTLTNMDINAITASYTAQNMAVRKARDEGKEVHELRLPASVAWKRRVNMDKLFAAKRVINEAISEIQQRYLDDEHSTAGENGARMVKAKYLPEFIKEQNDILSQDSEVTIRTIKPEELDGLELTDADMDTLAFMIQEGGE